MKSSEIRSLNIEEIESKLVETRQEFMLLRFQAVSGQLTDTSKINSTKRLIARLETILHEKRSGQNSEGKA